jgi:hypothetical protein
VLIRFFCQGNEKDYAQQNSLLLLLFFSSRSIYSATHFTYTIIHLYVYSHVTTTFVLRKMTWFCLYFTHKKRIFIYIANDVVVNVFFFLHCCCSLFLSMSILTCFDSYKREEVIQQVSAARG